MRVQESFFDGITFCTIFRFVMLSVFLLPVYQLKCLAYFVLSSFYSMPACAEAVEERERARACLRFLVDVVVVRRSIIVRVQMILIKIPTTV